MKLRTRLYKCARGLVQRLARVFDFLFTWIQFFCFCEEFHDFETTGIPYINVSARNGGAIRIGRKFRMNNGLSGNRIGFGKTPCVLQTEGGTITIGDNVGMSQTAIVAMANVSIGNNVLLGGGVKIYTSDFHSLDYLNRRMEKKDADNKTCSPVMIEDDVFVGAGSIILKGVSIGSKSIIGAGSVVTKNVPSGEVWAGNPAKFIRRIPG